MTPSEALKYITLQAAMWPNYTPPTEQDRLEFTARALADQLADVPFDHAVRALKALSTEGREFCPPVGVVKERAMSLTAEDVGIAAPTVDEALAEVEHAVRFVGYTGTPEWSHPIIADTVEAMGWKEGICWSTNPDAMRAHFMKIFDVVTRRHLRAAADPANPEMVPLMRGGFMTIDEAIEAGERKALGR